MTDDPELHDEGTADEWRGERSTKGSARPRRQGRRARSSDRSATNIKSLATRRRVCGRQRRRRVRLLAPPGTHRARLHRQNQVQVVSGSLADRIGCVHVSPQSLRPADAASASAARGRSSCCRSAAADPPAQRRAFLTSDRIADVVVALPPDLAASPPEYLTSSSQADGGRRRRRRAAGFRRQRVCRVSTRGRHRGHSRRGASAGERQDLIGRTVDAAARAGAAIAALSVRRDTVKRGDADRFIVDTMPRERDFPGADAAGVSRQTCCATRWRWRRPTMRPTKRCWPSGPVIASISSKAIRAT